MIIWINGAFGSGKTQSAYELHRRIPDSFVYDPENAGYFINKNIPEQVKNNDFQDFPMWREFNYSMLNHIAHECDGVIIAPMTIVNPMYFNEIVGRLREDGVTVNHFALCASKDVLLGRLRSRGERRNSWGAQQIERCLEGLSDEVFRYHLDTNTMTVEDVAVQIAAMSNIPLMPDDRGNLRKRYDRIMTQLRHIRFLN